MWLKTVFEAADIDGEWDYVGRHVCRVNKQLNPTLKESKIRLKFKEIQKSKEKLTTRGRKRSFAKLLWTLQRARSVFPTCADIKKQRIFGCQWSHAFFEAEQGVTHITEDMCLDIIRRYELSEEGRQKGFCTPLMALLSICCHRNVTFWSWTK